MPNTEVYTKHIFIYKNEKNSKIFSKQSRKTIKKHKHHLSINLAILQRTSFKIPHNTQNIAN